jgi:hypothetical protein
MERDDVYKCKLFGCFNTELISLKLHQMVRLFSVVISNILVNYGWRDWWNVFHDRKLPQYS